jgi:hypothetical protein
VSPPIAAREDRSQVLRKVLVVLGLVGAGIGLLYQQGNLPGTTAAPSTAGRGTGGFGGSQLPMTVELGYVSRSDLAERVILVLVPTVYTLFEAGLRHMEPTSDDSIGPGRQATAEAT